jgi:hypothetical protein
MSCSALFFAAQLRLPGSPNFLLVFLLGDEIFKGSELDEPDARDALSGDSAVASKS